MIPNSLNLFTLQFSFHLVFIESVLYFFEPIHTTCVFAKFTLRPEYFAFFFLARLVFHLEIILTRPV